MNLKRLYLCIILSLLLICFLDAHAYDTSPKTNPESLRMSALRQIATAPPTLWSNHPEYEVVSLMSSYYLLLFSGKHHEAHKKFAKAFHLNSKIENPYIKERNYFHFFLADMVDSNRDPVIDELKASEIHKRESMADYWDHQWERLEVKFSQEWIIHRVMEALNPPKPGENWLFGKQVENFITTDAYLTAALPIEKSTNAKMVFNLGDKLNLLMLLERGFLKTHQQLVKYQGRIVSKPYKSISDALLAIYSHLTFSARLTVCLINDFHAENLLMKEKLSSAEALYTTTIQLMSLLEDDFNDRSYFLTKAYLQRGHISILQGQLAVTQKFLAEGYNNSKKIRTHKKRTEMLGFYHRYKSQFYLHSHRLEKSNEELRKSNDYFVSIHNHNAIGGFAELARNLDLVGKPIKAIEVVNEGWAYLLQFEDRLNNTAFKDMKAQLISTKAQALLTLKEWKKLDNEIEKGLTLTNRPNLRCLLYSYEGDMNYARGFVDEAIRSYKSALNILPPNEQSDSTMKVNLKLGNIYYEKDLPHFAQPFLKQALAIHTAIRKSARSSEAYEAKLHASSVSDIESLLISNTYKLLTMSNSVFNDYSKQLLFYSELIKSRSIIDEMESMRRGTTTYIRPGAYDDMPPEIIEDLSKVLSFESTMIPKKLHHDSIFDNYNTLLSDLSKDNQPPVVIIEFVPVPAFDKLVVYVFKDNDVSWLVIDDKWSSIHKEVKTFRRLINESLELYTEISASFSPEKRTINRIIKIEGAIQDYEDKLGNSLFPSSMPGWEQPLIEIIRGKWLVVVPHGILHNLPFVSLSIGDGDQKRSIIDVVDQISFTPSYKTLRLVLDYYSSNLRNTVTKVLLVGDEQKSGLSNVNNEFNAIRSAFNNNLPVTFSGKGIKMKIRENPAVHFAVHGRLNQANPFESFLSIGDYDLKLYEILNLALFNTRVVTMASCESSTAEITDVGDDVWSLSTGFLFAGVPAVIGSLWNQEGRAAAHFYGNFYREISRGESVARAYKDAMLSVREIEHPYTVSGLLGYQNPAFWSGFHMIGE